MKLTKFVHDLSVQGICVRNPLIMCDRIIQSKIHETHKIWHPREQNYLSSLRASNISRECGKTLEIPEGTVGKLSKPISENAEGGEGGHLANSFCGGGMDSF